MTFISKLDFPLSSSFYNPTLFNINFHRTIMTSKAVGSTNYLPPRRKPVPNAHQQNIQHSGSTATAQNLDPQKQQYGLSESRVTVPTNAESFGVDAARIPPTRAQIARNGFRTLDSDLMSTDRNETHVGTQGQASTSRMPNLHAALRIDTFLAEREVEINKTLNQLSQEYEHPQRSTHIRHMVKSRQIPSIQPIQSSVDIQPAEPNTDNYKLIPNITGDGDHSMEKSPITPMELWQRGPNEPSPALSRSAGYDSSNRHVWKELTFTY